MCDTTSSLHTRRATRAAVSLYWNEIDNKTTHKWNSNVTTYKNTWPHMSRYEQSTLGCPGSFILGNLVPKPPRNLMWAVLPMSLIKFHWWDIGLQQTKLKWKVSNAQELWEGSFYLFNLSSSSLFPSEIGGAHLLAPGWWKESLVYELSASPRQCWVNRHLKPLLGWWRFLKWVLDMWAYSNRW